MTTRNPELPNPTEELSVGDDINVRDKLGKTWVATIVRMLANNKIVVYYHGSKKSKHITIDADSVISKVGDENQDRCHICGDGGQLVCCDGCDKSYHDICLEISATTLPEKWYCPSCLSRKAYDSNMQSLSDTDINSKGKSNDSDDSDTQSLSDTDINLKGKSNDSDDSDTQSLSDTNINLKGKSNDSDTQSLSDTDINFKHSSNNEKPIEVLYKLQLIARFRTQRDCAKYLRCSPTTVANHTKSKGGGIYNGMTIRAVSSSSSEKDSEGYYGLFENALELRPSPNAGREFSPEVVFILKQWLFNPDHVDNPYPDIREKGMLMKKTGLNKEQLEGWFERSRFRILKPLLKGAVAAAAAANDASKPTKRKTSKSSKPKKKKPCSDWRSKPRNRPYDTSVLAKPSPSQILKHHQDAVNIINEFGSCANQIPTSNLASDAFDFDNVCGYSDDVPPLPPLSPPAVAAVNYAPPSQGPPQMQALPPMQPQQQMQPYGASVGAGALVPSTNQSNANSNPFEYAPAPPAALPPSQPPQNQMVAMDPFSAGPPPPASMAPPMAQLAADPWGAPPPPQQQPPAVSYVSMPPVHPDSFITPNDSRQVQPMTMKSNLPQPPMLPSKTTPVEVAIARGRAYKDLCSKTSQKNTKQHRKKLKTLAKKLSGPNKDDYLVNGLMQCGLQKSPDLVEFATQDLMSSDSDN